MSRRRVTEDLPPVVPPETFTVSGPHRVNEVAPGESVQLDPSDPQTVRLLARGQITVPVSSRGQSAGVAPTEDDPGLPASAESEE